MDLKQAKQILTGMGLDVLSEEHLVKSSYGRYVSLVRSEPAFLHGSFNADELEAIATWMRNPSGVVEA